MGLNSPHLRSPASILAYAADMDLGNEFFHVGPTHV